MASAKERLRSALKATGVKGLPSGFDTELDELMRAVLTPTRPLDILLDKNRVLEHQRDRGPYRPNLRDSTMIGLKGLSGQVLDKMILDGSQLIAQDFSGTDLTLSSFKDASFVSVKLAKATCTNTDFTRAKMPGQGFEEVVLKETVFDEAQLPGAIFTQCKDRLLDGVKFRGADLTGADLAGLAMRQCAFDGAIAKLANISSSEFVRSSLTGTSVAGSRAVGARFTDTSMDAADLSWINLVGGIVAGSAREARLLIRFANFENAEFLEKTAVDTLMNMSSPDQKEAFFESPRGRLLPLTIFKNLRLVGCSFKADLLYTARFENCHMVGCNFSGAKIGRRTIGKGTSVADPIINNGTDGERYLRRGS